MHESADAFISLHQRHMTRLLLFCTAAMLPWAATLIRTGLHHLLVGAIRSDAAISHAESKFPVIKYRKCRRVASKRIENGVQLGGTPMFPTEGRNTFIYVQRVTRVENVLLYGLRVCRVVEWDMLTVLQLSRYARCVQGSVIPRNWLKLIGCSV
jgi:hypothetical protein